MENDWEILDKFEWVAKWFVWLRIFNNFVNMVIWTFWTWAVGYTFWIFFISREFNFIGYYVFLYSLSVNAFVLVFLDDYLYYLDRFLRDEQRRIRIEKIQREEERIKTKSERKEVIARAKKIAAKIRKYPRLLSLMEQFDMSPFMILELLRREEKEERVNQLNTQIEIMDKERELWIEEKEMLFQQAMDKSFEIDIE